MKTSKHNQKHNHSQKAGHNSLNLPFESSALPLTKNHIELPMSPNKGICEISRVAKGCVSLNQEKRCDKSLINGSSDNKCNSTPLAPNKVTDAKQDGKKAIEKLNKFVGNFDPNTNDKEIYDKMLNNIITIAKQEGIKLGRDEIEKWKLQAQENQILGFKQAKQQERERILKIIDKTLNLPKKCKIYVKDLENGYERPLYFLDELKQKIQDKEETPK